MYVLLTNNILRIFSDPPPYVVELDKHPHGIELQKYLGEVTGRHTVPNILANDEMRSLEASGKVAETLLGKLGKMTVDGKSSL